MKTVPNVIQCVQWIKKCVFCFGFFLSCQQSEKRKKVLDVLKNWFQGFGAAVPGIHCYVSVLGF